MSSVIPFTTPYRTGTMNDPQQEIVQLKAELDRLREEFSENVRRENTRVLREVANGISHNLNNLLTGVLLQAELIESVAQEPEVQECVKDILRSGRRAADLINRLSLSLREDTVDAPESINANDIIHEAIEATQPNGLDEAERRGQNITFHHNQEDLPLILATRTLLLNMLVDLIRNAIEAMPNGGTITIATRREGRRICMSVSDEGVGMDADTVLRAPNPFFTTKRTVGAGLGLSTVSGILSRWGGSMDIRSQQDSGTTVSLFLPVAGD